MNASDIDERDDAAPGVRADSEVTPEHPWGRVAGSIAAIAIVVLCLPLVSSSSRMLVLGTTTLVYAISAQGLNFLYGIAGQLSIAQGGLWGVGAYAAALAAARFGLDYWPSLGLGLAVAALVAALLGYPARRVAGHYFVISTFAFAEVATIFANNATSLTGGNQGLILQDTPGSLLGIDLGGVRAYYMLAAVVFLSGLVLAGLLHQSAFGRRLLAARQNKDLALSLGMKVDRDRFIAFSISGAYAGVAGVVFLYSTRYIQPEMFDAWAGITFVLVVMIGGSGTLAGPLVGSAIVVFAPGLVDVSPVVNQVVYGVILVAVIVVLPMGVVGSIREAWNSGLAGRLDRALRDPLRRPLPAGHLGESASPGHAPPDDTRLS